VEKQHNAMSFLVSTQNLKIGQVHVCQHLKKLLNEKINLFLQSINLNGLTVSAKNIPVEHRLLERAS
jgi:hypothetical protein